MAIFYNAKTYEPIDTEALEGVNLIVTLPAAFSETCTTQCVPGILSKLKRLREVGVRRVILVCSDLPFAIAEWVQYSKWSDADVEFASDYGNFQMREIVGSADEEPGKENLPPVFGKALRRAYVVLRDGKIIGKYVEQDSLKYTLDVEELIRGCKLLSGNQDC